MTSNLCLPATAGPVLQTPSRGRLDGDQVRSACTAVNTKKAYRSYLKGISTWVRATWQDAEEFFCEDGSLNLGVFLPTHFEAFLLHKMNAGSVKVSTQKGLKRVEADEDQAGRSRRVGKEPLTLSLYGELAKRTLALSDNGTWMRPTGIPPHVELFEQHMKTRQALNHLPDLLLDGFAMLLDEKCNLPARGKMVKLFCAIVGAAGSAFPVDIDAGQSAGDLKKAIKAEKTNKLKDIDAGDLQLFLAKKDEGRGAWLPDDDQAALDLEDGKIHEDIQALIDGEKMKATKTLQHWLFEKNEMPPPSTDQIHVLVVVPEQEHAQTGLWLVTGSVDNALNTKGIRCKLYWMATLRIGYYDPTRCIGNKNRVFYCDYVPDDSESPQNTVSSISLTTSVSNLDSSTDEFRFQRIEDEKFFLPYGKAESCHLVSRKQSRDHKREFAKYDRDSNNRLALSREMHGWFDGMSIEVPIVNMLPGSVEENQSIGTRRKVEVFVKVLDAQCTDRVFSRLKGGSTRTDDPLMMKTFVHEDSKYRFYQGKNMESHLYEGIQPAEFYDKLENVLATQKSAFKTRYFHPNISNTSVFSTPVAINSKADIRKKVISEIRSMELADKLNYPSSGYMVKGITGFKIYIYQRDHALGDGEAVIPKAIRDNKHVINFPKTNNKCDFHCIAFHKQEGAKKDPRRIQALVKQAFKQYCSYKEITYTLGRFRNFKPIDILQFDGLEECFKLNINVFNMDVETGKVECIRCSDKDYDSINILSHENHALYITNVDMLQQKYQCSTCEMVFVSSDKLRNHTKNQCELVNIESFPAQPTIYQPAPNSIRSMLTKYSIKDADHYIDHFIVYDFEAILKPTGVKNGENTIFTNEHIPVSVSVADSLTEEVRCCVSDDPKKLLKDMFQYIKKVAAKIQQYNVSKYESLLRKIINVHGLTDAEVPGLDLGKTYKTNDVNVWIQNGEFACFFDFHSKLTFGKKRSHYGKLKQCIGQVPVFGFNSGRYDINLIKADLFAVIGTDNITSVIKNPSYMCIATSDMKMLDISNYVPAGTSYAKYLSTYLGECKCDDKIRCVCGLGKGIFPYEYITSFDVLSQPEVPPKSAFDSALRSTSISDEDYVRVQFVWEHYGMKSIKDLLIWYNNLDVVPFIKTIKAQRELFKRFELDMFTDGLLLPGLSEKFMYQTCFNNLQQPKHLNDLLERQKYLCGLCYKQLTADTASADRINNKLGHIDGNILISCVGCNVARKNMSLKGFRHKKLLEFNSDRLVYSIDREEKDIYTKMKANIAGGPSIIFNRYANATRPRFDGIFGFLECDIRTPEHLKPYFSEMTPIFKNTLIDCSDRSVIGQHMFEYNEERKQNRAKPARKLIGSYFGEKSLIYAPLLKWYISHGMEITKTYSFIKASSHKAFAPFMEAVSSARREGDENVKSICKIIIEKMMKLVGNSAFGRSGMDMSKHKEVRYESDDKAIKAKIEHFTFHGMEELNDSCEFTMKKRKFNNKNPIRLSIAIYQLAKLRMLQFYYDCIDFYFDRSEFQYQEMDTDSAYIAFSCEKPFVECIKPELRLFKDEWSGDAMVSLSANNYIGYLPDESYKVKVSAKGVQQSGGRNGDVLNPDGFESVVRDRITLQGTNKGFRLSKETLYQKAKELEPKITMKIVTEWYSNQSDIQRFQEQKKRYDSSGGSYGDNSDLNVAELKAIMKNLIIHDRPQKTQAAVWATDLDKSTKKQFQSPFDSSPYTLQPGSSIRNFNVRIGSTQVFDISHDYDFHHFTNEIAKISAINGDLTPELVSGLLDYQTWSLTNRMLIADVSRLTERDVPQAIQIQARRYNGGRIWLCVENSTVTKAFGVGGK
ncbi:hypothetical protein PHYSODRAFT_326275 [Phytophthora sojae]|uniref:C2H2-type domain-containing protein n=1 Tax=Phytophthora sojae (strain P6497) TaxID=1094619 RepID=G4Z0D6_PHYSP|nr:hypothetical protein PHYSODRAFT_326275 [Phytophthora sojae]EGZ25222.1 hypothetical protein PHYSODRAFT_326275 [Phytophthora sojae]|eukprot:XP_009520510.1 hypothetical protein PHYSODRAFT_326275 [Phytophthora sojae]